MPVRWIKNIDFVLETIFNFSGNHLAEQFSQLIKCMGYKKISR